MRDWAVNGTNSAPAGAASGAFEPAAMRIGRDDALAFRRLVGDGGERGEAHQLAFA